MSLIDECVRLYRNTDPRDRKDALWICSADVMGELKKLGVPKNEDLRYGKASDWNPWLDLNEGTLFGIPLQMRDDVLPGTLELNVETSIDRAVKRAAKLGQTINVVKTEPFKWPTPPPQQPVTVKALVRKWRRQLKSG